MALQVHQEWIQAFKSSYIFLLFRCLPTFFLFLLSKLLLFAIKCQNNFLISGKARVAGECTIYPTASGGLGSPKTPSLLKMSRIFGFILFISLFSAAFRKRKNVMLHFFLSQMNVWLYPKAPTFCHEIPTFFLSFLLLLYL